AQAAEVCAIEKDARLVELLREQHLRAAGIGMYFSEPKRVRTPRMRKSSPSPPLEERVGERRPFPVRPNGGSSTSGKLEIIHADALEFLRNQPRDWTGWKLVANLPYSVASPILVELALAEQMPERMV